MSQLQRLEADILELQDRLTLRPVVDLACKMGEKLIEAKGLMPHGHWLSWLPRIGMRARTAQVYMQIAKANLPAYSGKVTIEGFLRIIRGSRRRAWQEELADTRKAAIDANLPLDPLYKVVHADCRKYRWPSGIDTIATDPPWQDMDAYRWLGEFARSHLKKGGVLLTQCGSVDMPIVLDVLREAGLTYKRCLAIVYQASDSPVVLPPFMAYWRPLLLLSNGSWERRNLPTMSDTKTVTRKLHKTHHPWQQPLDPWLYWLRGLTEPGQLTCDPFCGSALIGVVVKMLGEGRRYIGTEINGDDVLVARSHLKNAS